MSAKLPKPKVRTVESNARDGDAAAGSPLGFRGKGSRQTQQSNATHNPSPPSSSKSSSSFTHVKKTKRFPWLPALRIPYCTYKYNVPPPPLPVSQHTPPLCLISSDGTKTSLVAYLSALHVACLCLLFSLQTNGFETSARQVKHLKRIAVICSLFYVLVTVWRFHVKHSSLLRQ
ncbi:hypothetical protein V8C40DRAFT_25933 [Trichoderma camerunense]